VSKAFDLRTTTGDWDYRSLPENIRLGTDCYLERRDSFGQFRSRRDSGIVLGDRVRVLAWTTFNVEPTGCLWIGDDTQLIGPVFMCAGKISIGARCVLSYNVTIADCDFHPLDVEQRRSDAIANSPQGDRSARPPLVTKPVVIEDDVWVGIGAIVLKGVHVGKGAMIAAGAVVSRDVPAGSLAAGNPAVIADPGSAGPGARSDSP
jgi:acetyltransferase-like isoleucine patch superfamily enzyme